MSVRFRVVEAVSLLFFPSQTLDGESKAGAKAPRPEEEEEEQGGYAGDGIAVVSEQPLLLPPFQSFLVEPWGGSGKVLASVYIGQMRLCIF